VLKQSYRVPRAVHRFAEALIGTVKVRQPKQYLPRPADGALDRLSKVDTYQRTEYEILRSATQHIERGRSVMFLASCSYMLRPIIAVLRKHGIPFHNPYRHSNGFWNPLRVNARASMPNRILALLIGHPDYGDEHRAWTHGDLALWAELLEARNTLLHGVKSKLKAGDATHPVAVEHLADVFEPGALESLMAAWDGGPAALLEWWGARLVKDARKRAEFPIEVARKRGPQAFLEEPQVVVGTIHSVKGGERDVVYLFPDLNFVSLLKTRDWIIHSGPIAQEFCGFARSTSKH
jgi:DNA helicase-2/ATP-dependent DNA helicase PcrA